MLSLLLESCTERSFAAFIENSRCLYAAYLPFGLHHTRYLLPKIEEGFASIGKNPDDLAFIAAGIGPGSYTGIRTCAAIAKSFSYACKVPLIGVCTLEGFVPDRDGAFAAVIDARMGGAYFLKGKRSEGVIVYSSKPEICPLEEFHDKLNDTDILIGPSLEALEKRVLQQFPNSKWIWEEKAPDPLRFTQVAAMKFVKKEYTLSGDLNLLYLR